MLKRLIQQPLLVFLLLTGVLLTACGPVREPARVTDASTSGTLATQLELSADYKQIAQKYLTLAQSAASPLREEYQLHAITALLHINQTIRAKSLLNEINLNSLTPELRFHRSLLLSRIALLEGRTEQAIKRTPDLKPGTPASLAMQYYEIQAQAYNTLGNYLESARARINLESLLIDPLLTDKLVEKEQTDNQQSRIQENRKLIWNSLQQLSVLALNQLQIQPPPDILSGWMALASIHKTTSRQPEQLQQLVTRWKNQYPYHPATETLADNLLTRAQKIQQPPEAIALLLPFSGKLSMTARAIRDGLLATHYQQDARSRSTIRLYDTGDRTLDIRDIYLQAVQEGASFVIGPLDKNAVSHLANMESLPIPVLALNATETSAYVPDNFYQFGLLPEDEAQQAAERASLEGLGNAIVITPEGDWGERVYTSFSERFTELGGEILEQQNYSLESNDFSNQIRSLLNLDESWQRHRSLKILLGQEVKFEPRRRKDVDFVFMAAFPRQARLITPQLQFHHASDLPVYATSHIYSGKQNPGDDRDMNGVIFCDTPWTLSKQHTKGELQQSINQLWPNASTHYSRLYAIGIDAYNILPYLAWLKETQYERYTGVTGNLYLGQYNKIHRTLKWARFVNGRPSVIQQQLMPASLTGPGPSLEMIP